MVSQCANLQCRSSFKYFGDGRLFEFHRDRSHTELYWLCETCSQKMAVVVGRSGMRVVPLSHTKQRPLTSLAPVPRVA